jgi:hypothetical protein
MFDNLREDAASKSFEEEAKFQPAAGTSTYEEPAAPSRVLGMTSAHPIGIAAKLLFTVCIIGAMFLLVMEKIKLPI